MNGRGGLIGSVGLAACLTGWLAPGLAGQAQTRPAFRSGVDVIAVDVNVVDRNGQPVSGLTAEQFEVTVDGRPRRVASATFVDYASAGPAATGQPAAGARSLDVEASYASNERDEAPARQQGRAIMIAVDQLSFSPGSGRAAMQGAAKFLDRIQGTDRVGLVAYPGPGPSVAPTTERQAVRQALGRIIGTAETPRPVSPFVSTSEALLIDRGDEAARQRVIERECMNLRDVSLEACARNIDGAVRQAVQQLQQTARQSIIGLQALVNSLDRISGQKVLVVVSAGLIPTPTGHLDLRTDIQAVASAAASANVRIYVLHVATSFLEAFSADRQSLSETPFQDDSLLASGLEMLAGMSAGSLFRVVAGADFAFERVAKETSAVYLLGLDPVPADQDGKPHRIQVRVRVPNTTVRSRTSFVVPAASAAPATPDEAVADALRQGPLAKDLPIRLAAQTLQHPENGQMRVLVSADIGRGVRGPADVRVGFAISDQSGRVLGSAVDKMRLEPRGAGAAASWSYMNAIAIRPGSYTLRLAAADADGHVGSVEYQLDARVASGDGVALSDLFLFDPRRPPKQDWKTIVDGRIDAASLEIGLEMYPAKGKGPSSVAFDIADRPDGPAIVGVRAKPIGADSNRRWLASALLDLRLLPPGDYVAVATAFDNDKRLGRVSRPFRLEPITAAVSDEPRAVLGVAEAGGLLRRFDRRDVLTPEALQFFLGRLKQTDAGPAAEPLAAAEASVRDAQYDKAVSALTGVEPDRLSVPFLKGLALFGRGDLEPAAAQFRAALRLSSEFLPAAFYLGACYAAGGRDREAVGAWQTSLVSESEARILFDVLADGWLRAGDGPQAESIAREAIGRWPDDDRFLPRLAAAQTMQNGRGEAIDTLAPYLARHPDDTATLFLAMRILYDARAAGRPVKTAADDAMQAAKYAAAYKSAGGPRGALVDRWVTFLQQGAAAR
jgi:VWFA-related protein